MIKEAIVTADSIEEAISKACNELGVDESVVSHEVIKQPKKGFLGMGACPAEVKVFYEISICDLAKNFLSDILTKMGVENFELDVVETEDSIEFNISGDNFGAVIGRRGETLNSLQYLVCLVVNNSSDEYKRVSLNTNNYREKREKALESLGKKNGITAAKQGKNISLEPMNPYERKIIHNAVQKIRGAISWSEGEGSNRHVVIGPDPDYKPTFNRSKNFNGRNNNRRFNNNQKSFDKSKRINSNYEPVKDNPDVPLYGKITLDD